MRSIKLTRVHLNLHNVICQLCQCYMSTPKYEEVKFMYTKKYNNCKCIYIKMYNNYDLTSDISYHHFFHAMDYIIS